MNKLYLLVALGLSMNVEGADSYGSSGSGGWYAGDCFDEADFSSTYGYVMWDCGTECLSMWQAGGMGGGSSDYGNYGSYGGDYGSCYADDYACQTAFDNCYGDAYCETAVDACVTDYYTEYGATYGDEASYQTCLDATITSAGRKLNKIKLTSTASPAKDGSWPYSAGVVIYGTEELDTSYPTYCDHYHLYSFVISDVQPADSADSYALDFSGHGWTMMGFPGMCDYTDWAAIDYELFEDVVYATTGDQFAMTCGYYSEYEWSGYQSVFFQVDSMNALAKAVSAFALVATSALFL